MKRSIRILTLCIFSSLGLGHPLFAQHLLDHLPDDSLLVVYYPDVPKGMEAVKSSPVGELLAELDWRELVYTFARIGESELGEEQMTEAELRVETDKISERFQTVIRHLNGQVLFSIGNLHEFARVTQEMDLLREGNRIDWSRNLEDQDLEGLRQKNELFDAQEAFAFARDLQLLAEVRDGGVLLENLADWSREMIRENAPGPDEHILSLLEEDWGPYRVYSLREELPEDADDHQKAMHPYEFSPHWTVMNDVMIMTMHEQALRDAIDRLEQRPGTRLGSSAAFLDAAEFHGDFHTLIYANLPALGPFMRLMLQDDGPVAPGEMAFDTMHDWLALDALVPFSFSTTSHAEGGISKFRFGFTRETPLSRILMSTPPGAAPQAPFVHKDVGSMSTGHFSLPRFYEALEAEITALAPEAGAVFGMARMYAFGAIGFDFKLQFLDHLGSEITLIAESDPEITAKIAQAQIDEDFEEQMRLSLAHTTGGNYLQLAIQLQNQAGLSASMNTLMDKLFQGNAPEPIEILEHPVYFPFKNFPGVPGDLGDLFSFTYLDNHLVITIAPERLIMQSIQASRDPAERLWNDPVYLDARRLAPDEAHGIDYTSGREFRTIFGNLHTAMNTLARSVGAPTSVFPNFEEIGGLMEIGVGATRRRNLILEAETHIRLRQPE